jgi:microsomal dipeptidase-like Zn-dependent dipeptidase
MIAEHNEPLDDAEKIPVVVSHTGYSGHATMEEAILEPDSNDKYRESGLFNTWSINLCDDEVIHVFNSHGLIGLNFDERILSGHRVLNDYNIRFKKKDIRNRTIEVQKFWAQQMLNNILGIVKAVLYSGQVDTTAKVRIWDMISIGTDFDGMINAVDAYITAEEFIDLRNVLEMIMPEQDNIGHLLQGLTVEQALDKLMFENAYRFARKHYVIG